MKTRYDAIPAYITKDGSEIRELMHPAIHGAKNQSLAEAIVQAGESTQLHVHRTTEEIYHVTQGQGLMTLGGERFSIARGDTILIPPGTPHAVTATGPGALHILCCCSPPYAHTDTDLEAEDRDS